MSKPTTPVSSAAEWVAADAAWQVHVFETTGKRPARYDPPNASLFPTAEMCTQATTNRLIVCDKPDHVGDRLLTKTQRYGPSTCKACKCAAQTKKKATPRPPPVVYASAEAWFKAVAPDRSETYPSIVGNCPRPTRDSFETDLEFERAKVLHHERYKLYQRQYNQLDHVRAKDSDAHREKYAQKKARVEEDEQ
jgi:hypothetical protein